MATEFSNKVMQINLSKGKVALVDAEDYERVSSLRWHAKKKGKTWYAMRSVPKGSRYENGEPKYKACYMHRLIMGAPEGIEVDHENGDGLDNRRSNLRLATKSQNQQNQPLLHGANTSGYRGVSKHSLCTKWRAEIKCGLAARAYDSKARELFGEYARLNFPICGERGVQT